MVRAEWGSRLGFILAAAGSAIGLGAIWKFPYVTAKNGGGAFLLLFLLIVFTLGISIMIAEMIVGQISQKSPVGAYRYFGGKLWSLVGYISVMCGFLILSFYSVIGGWTVFYFMKSIEGNILTSDAVLLKQIFDHFISHPTQPLWYHAAFMIMTVGVVIVGVQKGIERASKSLMMLLFLLILVLVVRSLTLPGASEGILYFLTPDFSKVNATMVLEALGLSFFSLSLGMGCMMTYGSYVSKETNISSSAGWVVGLTTVICLLVGLMILPAVFAFGLNPSEGPGLTFIIMPAVFSQMGGSQFFAILFFFLLFLAALTSSVSLMEVVTSFFIDEFNLPRLGISIMMAILMFVIGIAASLSLGPWREYTLFGQNFFNLLDYLTSHLMMPFGGIMITLLLGWKAYRQVGEKLVSSRGANPWWWPLMKQFCRYVAPLLILLILLQNL